MNRRAVIVLGALALLLVTTVILTGRPPRNDAAPEGTLALRRFLKAMDLKVEDGQNPPSRGTFFLLNDFRSGRETDRLLSWVQRGGVLVLADPLSRLAQRMGVKVATGAPRDFASVVTVPPGCVTAETPGVTAIAARGADFRLNAERADAVHCFDSAAGSYLVEIKHGGGKLVVVGGRSLFTNELLRHEHNAVLAYQLLSSDDDHVVFGSPVAADSRLPRGFWSVVPTPAKLVIAQLVLALIAFAFVRGRRLGRPVPEEPISPIPAGELVGASADLMRQARTTTYAAGLVREGAIRRVARRLGISRQTDAATIAKLAAKNPDQAARLNQMFNSDVVRALSDEEFLEFIRSIEEETRAMEGSAR
jgi:hypothetical protein